jgi:hypothetical protein
VVLPMQFPEGCIREVEIIRLYEPFGALSSGLLLTETQNP